MGGLPACPPPPGDPGPRGRAQRQPSAGAAGSHRQGPPGVAPGESEGGLLHLQAAQPGSGGPPRTARGRDGNPGRGADLRAQRDRARAPLPGRSTPEASSSSPCETAAGCRAVASFEGEQTARQPPGGRECQRAAAADLVRDCRTYVLTFVHDDREVDQLLCETAWPPWHAVRALGVVTRGQAGCVMTPASVHQAYRFALDPNPSQQRALASAVGGARFAYNWGLELVKGRLDERAAGHDVQVPWTLPALRREWNRAKDQAAPWWADNSKEAYSSGLDGLARALKNFSASRHGHRKGRPVGFPRFKRRGRRDTAGSPPGRSECCLTQTHPAPTARDHQDPRIDPQARPPPRAWHRPRSGGHHHSHGRSLVCRLHVQNHSPAPHLQ